MKALVVLSILAGCSYAPPTSTNTDSDAMPGDDAMTSTPTDTAQNPGVAPCNTPDATGLVLCLEMEDGVDDSLADSSQGHHDAAAQNLTAAMRTVPGESPAIEIHPNTVIRVPETSDLDRDSAYTIAMWIHPNTLPTQGTVYGLMDHENQFAMLIGRSSVDGSLQNRCVHTGRADFEFSEQLPENAWSFLACTWDGTEMCAWRWSADRDTERYCHQPALPPQTSGAEGLAIGHLSENGAAHSRFDGAMDSVQIYDRGMSETQLCALIGKNPGCMPCLAGTCL